MAVDATFASEHDDEVLLALATLYLICAKATDDDLAPEEIESIYDRLTVRLLELHADGEDPAHGPELRARSRSIVEAAGREYRAVDDADGLLSLLDRRAKYLRDTLSLPALERALLDLIDLAESDGSVSAAECEFVGAAARTFGVPLEQAGAKDVPT
jgi:hypothetical protein